VTRASEIGLFRITRYPVFQATAYASKRGLKVIRVT